MKASIGSVFVSDPGWNGRVVGWNQAAYDALPFTDKPPPRPDRQPSPMSIAMTKEYNRRRSLDAKRQSR